MNLAITNFSWVKDKAYQKLFACLPDPAQMRFVGGCVRNTLLGLPFDDVDFATSYRPEEIMSFFKKQGCKVIPTGLEHGTVTVLSDGVPYEITTLRRDVETDGRHAIIAYTPVWEEDAHRRDFTMNALYVDHNGHIHDCVGGQDDIEHGVIRFIGIPEQRIAEDYLRILRFFRFWALYGRYADRHSLKACCCLKHHLKPLSSERITKEMLKMLGAKNPWPMMRMMKKEGFDPLIWGHSTPNHAFSALETLENIWGPATILVRLCTITGSMPQRLTLSREQKKQMGALWLPFDSEKSIDCVEMTSLEASKEIFMGLCMRKLNRNDLWKSVYDYGIAITQQRVWMMVLRTLVDFGRQKSEKQAVEVQDFVAVQNSDIQKKLALEHENRAKGMVQDIKIQETARFTLSQKDRDWLSMRKKDLCFLEQEIFPEFSLTGRDVMSWGISGPEVGRVLQETKSWWIQHHAIPNHEACLDYAKKLL